MVSEEAEAEAPHRKGQCARTTGGDSGNHRLSKSVDLSAVRGTCVTFQELALESTTTDGSSSRPGPAFRQHPRGTIWVEVGRGWTVEPVSQSGDGIRGLPVPAALPAGSPSGRWRNQENCLLLAPWPGTHTAPPLLRDAELFCRRKTRAPRSTAGCVCSSVAFRGWNRDTGPICGRGAEKTKSSKGRDRCARKLP